MARPIQLSDEELAELGAMLHRETATSRHELRRTRNPGFREQVRHHIDVVAHITESVEAAAGPHVSLRR